jgi:hypothetical protein
MENIPFFEDLKRPLYPLPINPFASEAGPARDEVEITADWTIELPPNASEQVTRAAQDLHAFLREGCLDLPVVHAGDGPASGPRIRLTRARSADAPPESYRIAVSAHEIDIDGADDSGVMYGIYHLEELMRVRKAPVLAAADISRKPILRTRILRSPMSFFHRRELPTILEAYPETYLHKMSHHGFNGIWLRGRLAELAKVDVFPEFGADADRIHADLNALVQRAAAYGIRVYMFFNEPLAMRKNSEFFRKYPHLKGQPLESEDVYAMCTSTPEVQTFLREGMAYLFRHVPGLAGTMLITASEFHTHCFSHHRTRNTARETWQKTMECPRCRERTPQEVVGEVVTCIRDGVKSANPAAEVIAWNWSWTMYEDDPQESVVRALPDDVCVMADFERGGKRVTDGFSHVVDEYSLGYVGPSERFKGTAAVAREQGRAMFAKLQIGVTHELATIPYLPVYPKLARKFINQRDEGVVGAMECWNFGNILSPTTEIAHWFSWEPLPESVDHYLAMVAGRDFGEKAAPAFVSAWHAFAEAMDHYPFSIPLLYWGPQHFGPAFPLYFRKVDRHMPLPWLLPAEVTYDTDFAWMSFTEFGDQIDNYLGGFTPEKLVSCFDNLIADWQRGVDTMQNALEQVPDALQANAEREFTVAAAALSQFTTARNVTEFIHLRNQYWDTDDTQTRRPLLKKLLAIAENEIRNAADCRDLALRNPMLGFHGEAFGFDYTPAKIDAKLATTKETVADMEEALADL